MATWDYATDDGSTTDPRYYYYDPNSNVSTLQISGSIDAAAASLQLGTDDNETQVIEIGTSNITTTFYGDVNAVQSINGSSMNLTNSLSVTGKTTLNNVSVTGLTSTNMDVTNITKLNVLNVTGNASLPNITTMNASINGTTSIQGTMKVNGDATMLGYLTLGTQNTFNVTGAIGGQLNLAGTLGDPTTHSKIYTRLYDADLEASEMVLYKGNDGNTSSGPDRIRFKANEFIFDDLGTTTDDPNVSNIVMAIKDGGNVGIGTFSPTSTLDVSGSMAVSGPATMTSLSTKGYKSNLFNYTPTFTASPVGGISAITNGEYNFTLSTTSGSIVSTIPVLFRANTKYTVTLTAYASATISINLINAGVGFTFPLTTTSTTYTKIITMPTTDTTSLSMLINGQSGNKVTWSNLTIEPYYDMMLGSNTVSLAGDVNVSSGSLVTGWATKRMITSSTTTAMGTTSSIAYGNGIWIMVGATGVVLASDNEGATWTSTQVGSTTNITRGCAYGNGLFVMNTAENPGKNYTSANGTSWTTQNNLPAGLGINTTAFGNSVFVGVSTDNAIYQSTNGTTWNKYTVSGPWFGIAYGNSIFVACGTSSIAKGNSTGTSWAAIGYGGSWRSIAYGNGIFMVCDIANGTIMTSTDATSWSTVYSFGVGLTSVLYDDNAWFVSNSTTTYISYDNGVTWTNTGVVMYKMSSGNGKILGGYQNTQTFLTKRTARPDGTTITSDTITIGGEGSTLNIGSDTINVSGVLNLTSIGSLTTALLNTPTAYIGSNTIDPMFNYGPTFVNGGTVTVSGNELSITIPGGVTRESNTPISPDLLIIGSKFLVTITARGDSGTSLYPFDESNFRFYLTPTMTTYTRLLTLTAVPSQGRTYITFFGPGTITWSTITFVPYNYMNVNSTMNVSGSLTVRGSTKINTTGSTTTTIGSATSATTVGGSLGVTGTTTINTTGSATTMIGSATSATTISGVLNASNVSTTVLNATNAFIGTKTIDPTFNYGPSFVDANTTVSGNEFSVTVINDYSYKYSNTPIPMDLFNKGAKFQVTITARGPQGSWISVLSQNGGSDLIYLTSVMTTYRKVLTVNSVPSSGNMIIYGNGTITWSTIMFEPYSLSVNGGVDVSGSLAVSGPTTVTSLKTSGYTSNLFNYAPTFTKTLVGGTLTITNGVSQFTLSGNSGSVVSTVPVLFRANTKYTVTLTAFGDSGTSINLIDAAAGFTFSLTTTSTAYTKILTMPTDTTSMSLLINGTATKKVSWSNLTIEPYYDMTLGSNTLSIAGDINVSSGATITGWSIPRIITTSTAIPMNYVSSIAYGNGIWIMVGTTGIVLASNNEGATWASTQVGSTTNLARGCAFGNGIFVMNTSENPGKNYTSSNGTSWTTQNDLPAGTGINTTTFGNSVFVGVSTGAIYQSTNGITWNKSVIAGNWSGVTYGNSIFVACTSNSIAKSNSAGTSWALIASPPTGIWESIAYGNGIYMICERAVNGAIATSTDATTWTIVYTFGFSLNKVIYDDNAWFVSNTGSAQISYNNGLTWASTKVGATNVIASGNGKILGGYQDNQTFLTKRTARTDGTTITSDTITIGGEGSSLNIVSDNLNVSTGNPTTLFTYTSSSSSLASRYGAYGNGIFVVSDDSSGTNKVLKTTDGLTATFYTPPSTTTLRGLAYGLINGVGTFVLSSYAVPSRVWLSTDGQTWTGPTATTLSSMHTIAYGNGVFIAGCITDTTTTNVGVSTNGTTWTSTQTVSNTLGINKMAFGAMTTGVNVFLGLHTNFLCRSVNNGSNWNIITIPNGAWTYCEFGNDVFIAVGNEADSKISISRDGGLTWSPTITFGLKLSNAIYVDNTWYIGSMTGFTLISKDNALTWEKKNTGFNTFLFVYGNDKLLSFTASALTLVNAKTRRSNGMNITADTITIGREGSTLNVGDTLNVGGRLNATSISTTSLTYYFMYDLIFGDLSGNYVNGFYNTGGTFYLMPATQYNSNWPITREVGAMSGFKVPTTGLYSLTFVFSSGVNVEFGISKNLKDGNYGNNTLETTYYSRNLIASSSLNNQTMTLTTTTILKDTDYLRISVYYTQVNFGSGTTNPVGTRSFFSAILLQSI